MKIKMDLPEIREKDIIYQESGFPFYINGGSRYLLKFKRSGCGSITGDRLIHDPIMEYLSSHIFLSFGLSVQETRLFLKDGEIVCGCRDLTENNREIILYEDMFPSVFTKQSDIIAPFDFFVFSGLFNVKCTP